MLGHAVGSEAIVYADEDRVNAAAQHFAPRLKPDYSPDFLLSSAYIGRPIAIGPEVARRLPPLVADNSLALEHELALAACEVADSVRHISEVLCHRYEPAAADSPAPIGAHQVEAALRRRGDTAQVAAGRVPGTFQILRPTTAEAVSILVPFRDEPRLLRECVDSVTATTRDNNIEFVLIDNGSSDPEVFTMLERLDTRNDVRVISDPRPFNWARLNNEGARVAQGTVLLFLNNDIEAQRDGWLSPLIAHAMRPDVGAVGGRLLYPDGRLQHCGVVVGLIGAAGHPLLGLPNEAAGYLNMALATRECSAVTGACMATRSDVFDRLNGFDETLGVDLNDIDFCLRAFAAGYRTVYEPAAELIHHESPSRGTAGGAEDIVKFVDRWRNYISAGDPYFNPHLTRTDVTCGLAGPDEGDTWDRWYSSVVA
jgi:GT2 family glycosyltransferase